MDKKLNRGGKPFKQWRGAYVSVPSTLSVCFADYPTGGVPTWPYGVDMYQFRGRFVANENDRY